MAATTIPASNLEFLAQLRENNDRDWFEANKDWYQREHKTVKEFMKNLQMRLQEHDLVDNMKLFRIYRDVRFSKDKSPYKAYWSCGYHRGTEQLRGGYYISISPEETYVGGGFYDPNRDDLELIRKKIDRDTDTFRAIIEDPTFKKYFGEIQGDQVKTAPRGYTLDNPAIDLLRYKQFIIRRIFTPEETLAPDFIDQVDETYRAMRPFFNHMTDVLTTDMNGVPLYE